MGQTTNVCQTPSGAACVTSTPSCGTPQPLKTRTAISSTTKSIQRFCFTFVNISFGAKATSFLHALKRLDQFRGPDHSHRGSRGDSAKSALIPTIHPSPRHISEWPRMYTASKWDETDSCCPTMAREIVDRTGSIPKIFHSWELCTFFQFLHRYILRY
jgi:hypothetical protein